MTLKEIWINFVCVMWNHIPVYYDEYPDIIWCDRCGGVLEEGEDYESGVDEE